VACGRGRRRAAGRGGRLYVVGDHDLARPRVADPHDLARHRVVGYRVAVGRVVRGRGLAGL
jgi:hypothetical protein